MTRRSKPPFKESPPSSTPGAVAVVQLKVWLLGIRPMVWRRLLVPSDCTLRELHGIIQVAMGWEGLHLYQFRLRARHFGSWELSASSPDVTLVSLRLRTGTRFTDEDDLNLPWRHEVRVEGHWAAGQAYPRCTGGHGAGPPEDCGGPAGYFAGLDETMSLDALDDVATMVEILREVVLDRRPERLDAETRPRPASGWSRLSSAAQHANAPGGSRSCGVGSMPACARVNTATSCTRKADALGSALGEQIGSHQRRFVPTLPADASDQGAGRRIGQLVESALKRGGRRLGVVPGGGDALVAEKALQVGHVHAQREQPRRHPVP